MEYSQCTLDDVAAALQYLDESDQQTWINMGLAIKSEFGDSGFDVWNDWGAGYDRYKPAEALTRWRSFKMAGAKASIRIASLFKLAIENGYKPAQKQLTAEDEQRLARERAQRAKRLEAEHAKERAETARWYELVAEASQRIWGMLRPDGNSPYLEKKQIPACGIRFVAHPIVIVFCDDPQRIDVLTDREQIADFWQHKTEETVFRSLKPGAVVVPLFDIAGQLCQLQIIYPTGKKAFLKHGPKSGLSYRIGNIYEGAPVVFAEGFATAASLYLAAGWPAVVALDAGNLPVVAKLYRKALPGYLFVIAGDNDAATEGNPGRAKALEAANDVGGVMVLPEFVGVVNG